MSQAIKDAWELIEIIGILGIIILVLLTIAPIAFVLWLFCRDREKEAKKIAIQKRKKEEELNNIGNFLDDVLEDL